MIARELLTRWVALKHQAQIIKCSGEPYFTHLTTVAQMAEHATDMGYEIGLCHDLLEDTTTTQNELADTLISFNYTSQQAVYITNCVIELTDVFTAAAYPGISKTERKQNEAARLATISAAAQTVKYCDLIDNIQWVLQHDVQNAPAYLQKKYLLLNNMVAGNAALRHKALNIIEQARAI